MAEITAAAVKELRERTGAGMMDCKKALAEANGDMEAAVDWLRAKGLAAAAKKSGRTAAEGLVGVAVEGTRGAVVEVNSETDFVAKNEQFQQFVRTMTQVMGDGSEDISFESVRTPVFLGPAMAVVFTDSTMTADGTTQQLRYADVLIKRDGQWAFQTMLQSGWGDNHR